MEEEDIIDDLILYFGLYVVVSFGGFDFVLEFMSE